MAVGNIRAVTQVDNLFIEKRYSEAIILAEKTLLKLKNRSSRLSLYYLLGCGYNKLKDPVKAEEYFRKGLNLRRDKKFYESLLEIYEQANDVNKLEILLQDALKHHPSDYDLLSEFARAFINCNSDDKALYYFIELKKWGLITSLARYMAFWDSIEETDELFVSDFRAGKLDYSPVLAFTSIQIPAFTQQELGQLVKKSAEIGYEWFLQQPPLVEGFDRKVPMKKKGPLKIGYLSSDIFTHATMLLLSRVLELHDNAEFEIHLFILNSYQDSDSIYGKRIEEMNVKRHRVSHLAKEDVAKLIKDENIHILVDLKGYTKNSGTAISALRPAPIVVNWLGFPNTFGVERLADYIITDPIVTPLEHAPFFSETLAYMPHCYQPNDNTILFEADIKREIVGLPEDKIVYCSFNQIAKLHPRQFDYWCRVLRDVPDSVLWLLSPEQPLTRKNILREAEKRGIEADRIIFAPKSEMLTHRLRLTLADIAFDSFPCTSHTTASDLMAACVPLIAQIGHTFPSRVSASVVTANNCSQLIAHNIEEAYSLAYALGTNKDLLRAVKDEMKKNLKTAPLYNSELFTKNLERLYKEMWEQYQHGKKEIITLD